MPETSKDWAAMGNAMIPHGDVMVLYQRLLEGALRAGRGLRVQLDFRDDAMKYAGWAWETAILNGQYLTANPQVSICRTVAMLTPAMALKELVGPFQLLIMLAMPMTYRHGESQMDPTMDLSGDLQRDLELINHALSPLVEEGLLEITVLQGKEATASSLGQKLLEKSIDAFYFSGHSDGKSLLFDDGSGVADFVDGEKLGSVISGSPVRLVFLNASNCAYGTTQEAGGTAIGILGAGIPAVVAFQGHVYSSWASQFAGVFFTHLTKLNSLELATFAGRKEIHQIHQDSWPAPMLFTRYPAGEEFLSGDIGTKISAYLNAEGELEFREQGAKESSAEVIKQQMQSLIARIQEIDDIEARAKADQETVTAMKHVETYPDKALQLLSATSVTVAIAIKRQKQEATLADELKKAARIAERNKRRERYAVLLIAALMIVVIGFASLYLDAETKIAVLGLPVPVVLWSFIGGVAATLHAFVGTQKYAETEPLRLDWLIGRPLVGIVMGSVVYLAVATSLSAVGSKVAGQDDTGQYLLWVLAFLGGFSDRFALLLFDNLVGRFSEVGALNGDEEPQPNKQNAGLGSDSSLSVVVTDPKGKTLK
jgi:hypothetical protein